MNNCKYILLFSLLMVRCITLGQVNKTANDKWIKVSDDDDVEIYYNSNIKTDKKGQHIVWVKAVYHTTDWQMYFSRQIGSKSPVVMTKTKVLYDEIYSYVMVRQVQCFNKFGKLLFDSGDDRTAGWGPVNASDPVGIVGEYLGR